MRWLLFEELCWSAWVGGGGRGETGRVRCYAAVGQPLTLDVHLGIYTADITGSLDPTDAGT